MLEFDEASHTYRKDGLLVPNVTTILNLISGYDKVPAAILERAAAIGNAVHTATELFDQDDLDAESLDDLLVPYVSAWDKFKRERAFIPALIEERVFHKQQWYAGTLDRTGTIDDSEEVMLDIKSTVVMMPSTGPQLAAYQNAYNYRRKDKIKRRIAVQLKSNGTYQVHDYNNKADLPRFLACLTVHNTRTEYGI